MMILRKVKGQSDLVKDVKSNAVLNTDTNALEAAKKAKQKALEEIQRTKSIESRLDQIETLLQTLLREQQCSMK